MNRLRVTYSKVECGDYGANVKTLINLQCSYKYKIFWIEKIGWTTIFEVYESDLPSVRNKKELLEVMVDLWSKNRKKTLPSRLKSKVIDKLNYA